MIKKPDRLYINKKDKKKYDELLKKGNLFAREKGFQNKDLFLISVLLGYQSKHKEKLENREGYILTNYLSDEELHMLYSLVIDSNNKDLSVLNDLEKVFIEIEEYANTGIDIFYDKVFRSKIGDYDKKMEMDIVTLFKEIINND